MNIVNPYRYGSAYLLDTYTGSKVAYSLMKLSATTTNVARIKRSSDNAEDDFTETEITDGTLTTWTGANDGYVVILYDQSGNANNATATGDVKIVTTGVLETENGKATMQLTATTYFTIGTTLVTADGIYDTFSLFHPKTDTAWCIYSNGAAGAACPLAQIGNTGTINFGYGLEGPQVSPTSDVFILNEVVYPSGNNQRAILYTACLSLQSLIYVRFINDDLTHIWGRNSFSMVGNFQEILIWQTDQRSNRSGIDANINARYSIY